MENLIKIGLYLLIYQKKDTVTQVPNSKNAPEMYARDELASPVSAKIITKTNDVVNQKSINNKNLTPNTEDNTSDTEENFPRKSLDITDVEDTERTLAAANDENHLILKT